MDYKNYNRTEKQLILLFGGVGCCFVAYYLISEGFSGKYLEFWIVFLGSFFGIIGFYSIYIFLNYKRFDETNSYKKENNAGSLNSGRVKGYALYPLLTVGILSMCIAYYFYSIIDVKLSKSDTISIKGVITSKIEVKKSGKSSKIIKINLKEYPEFTFEIVGVTFNATDTESFIKNVKTGDTISVITLKDEYKKKISHELELGFGDKTNGYESILIYGLYDKNYEYLTLEAYNESNRKDAPWGVWMFGLAGIYFLGSAVYSSKN